MTDYELTVHSNFTLPSHLEQCSCGLCSKQGILVLSKTLGFVVEGCFKAGLPEGEDVQVELQYVIVHELRGGTMPNRAYPEEWVVKQLGAISAAQFCTSVAAHQLVSSYKAAIAMKREQHSLRSTTGTFHTYIRAEVNCIGAQGAHSFRVYSPEVYVSNSRQLRKISDQQHSSAEAQV